MKICAFVTVCLRIAFFICRMVYLETWQKCDRKGQISIWMAQCILSIWLGLESSFWNDVFI